MFKQCRRMRLGVCMRTSMLENAYTPLNLH